MKKEEIINQAKRILIEATTKLDQLGKKVNQEQPLEDELMAKLNKIEDNTEEIRKGVIG